MNYALIGEHLSHSFSCDIHKMLSDCDYSLVELSPDKLASFILSKDYRGLNVTMPYKKAVMPFLDRVSDVASRIGAVNTVVNDGGILCGYNTDYFGLESLCSVNGISLHGKNVLIIGSGGAAATAHVFASDSDSSSISHCVRNPAMSGELSLYGIPSAFARNVQVIVNATPCGMSPDLDCHLVSPDMFPSLEAVVDLVYNPLRTSFVLSALDKGLKACGGLYMLVAQAFRSRELFECSDRDSDEINQVYQKIICSKSNVVLCGMPSCGKSTVGKMIAARTGKQFIDTDILFEERHGISPSRFISLYGETSFRDVEAALVKSLGPCLHSVISVGGGTVLRDDNVRNLKHNGNIIFVDRSLDLLAPSNDRPLSSDVESLKKMFAIRRPIYERVADRIVSNDGSPDDFIRTAGF